MVSLLDQKAQLSYSVHKCPKLTAGLIHVLDGVLSCTLHNLVFFENILYKWTLEAYFRCEPFEMHQIR
jgi:hypothetical protein